MKRITIIQTQNGCLIIDGEAATLSAETIGNSWSYEIGSYEIVGHAVACVVSILEDWRRDAKR